MCLIEKGKPETLGDRHRGSGKCKEGQNIRVRDPPTGKADRWIEESAYIWVDGGQMDRQMH